MHKPFKEPVSVLVLIHTPDLSVLLLERTAHPGFWQSVTGSVEPGETLAATALREVAEETGILAEPQDLEDWSLRNTYEIFPQWRHRYAPGVTENVEHVFSLTVPEQFRVSLRADEHRDFCWLPWQSAADRVFSWTNRDAILLLATGAIRQCRPGGQQDI